MDCLLLEPYGTYDVFVISAKRRPREAAYLQLLR
jgi:hypothetical protein